MSAYLLLLYLCAVAVFSKPSARTGRDHIIILFSPPFLWCLKLGPLVAFMVTLFMCKYSNIQQTAQTRGLPRGTLLSNHIFINQRVAINWSTDGHHLQFQEIKISIRLSDSQLAPTFLDLERVPDDRCATANAEEATLINSADTHLRRLQRLAPWSQRCLHKLQQLHKSIVFGTPLAPWGNAICVQVEGPEDQ